MENPQVDMVEDYEHLCNGGSIETIKVTKEQYITIKLAADISGQTIKQFVEDAIRVSLIKGKKVESL